MSTRKHSNWIEAYLKYASHSEAPDTFHFWTAVSTIAGALRRRVWLDMGYFQWTPNMYIIFVAPPGIVSKSTTANIGMRLLRRLPDIKFGPDAVTWQSLTMSLAESTEEVVMPNGEFMPMSCITIASSEFGTFLNPADREMVDVMVSLWDGQIGVWEKRTKTQGDDMIVNPWINMIACTTPAWIAGNFPDYMIGGGFTSRCVFVYAEEKRQLVAYPGLEVPESMSQQEDDLVHDLEIISQLVGEYKMEHAAQRFGTEWYHAHYKETLQMVDNREIGYRARKQTHVHKLALVLAASKRDHRIITKGDLEEAIQIVTNLETDMPKVFHLIGRTEGAKTTGIVEECIHRFGAIYEQDLVRALINRISNREIQEGVKGCLAAGSVQLFNMGGKNLYRSIYLQQPESDDQRTVSSQTSLTRS